MQVRSLLLVCSVCIALGLVAFPAWSHPHVFVSGSAKAAFDAKGLAGFHVQWVFDEMFSSSVILDFDRDGNGRFDPGEAASMQKDFFMPLREFDYFTHIKIDGKPFRVSYVTGFTPDIRDGMLVCLFFAPCHVPAGGSFREVKLSLYDQSYYHSVTLERNPVTYENNRTYEVSHRVAKNRDEAYYYGQVYPDEITLRFGKKNG
jgi:ABC-type uncharacterized transport system substrate-binding protein